MPLFKEIKYQQIANLNCTGIICSPEDDNVLENYFKPEIFQP